MLTNLSPTHIVSNIRHPHRCHHYLLTPSLPVDFKMNSSFSVSTSEQGIQCLKSAKPLGIVALKGSRLIDRGCILCLGQIFPQIFGFLPLLADLVKVIPGYENFILINFYWTSSIVIRLTRPRGFARCRSDTKSFCPTAIIVRTEFSFNRVRPTLMFSNEF